MTALAQTLVVRPPPPVTNRLAELGEQKHFRTSPHTGLVPLGSLLLGGELRES